MRRFVLLCMVAVAGIGLAVIQGCDWEDTGSAGFNTSRGAGVNVNFSGYYRPKSGDFIVGSNQTYMVITQTGNTLEVLDSNNSFYSGYVGAPGVLAAPDLTGTYGAGASILQAQISFSGVNAATRAQVQFVGIVRAVAVSDILSVEEIRTDTGMVNSNSTFEILRPPVSFGDSTEYQTDTSYESTHTYSLNEGNTWYVLEGSWIEGGIPMAVAARAPAVDGSFSVQNQP